MTSPSTSTPSTSLGTPRKSVHSEARNILKNVIQFFDKQKAAGVWSFPLEKATELAAAATGKSTQLIKNIRKESIAAENELLKSPSKKRRSGGSNKIVLDDADLGVLKRTVHEVYTIDKQVPTMKILVNKMKEKVDYCGGPDTLRRSLKRIGFKYRKCHDKRKLLMERKIDKAVEELSFTVNTGSSGEDFSEDDSVGIV